MHFLPGNRFRQNFPIPKPTTHIFLIKHKIFSLSISLSHSRMFSFNVFHSNLSLFLFFRFLWVDDDEKCRQRRHEGKTLERKKKTEGKNGKLSLLIFSTWFFHRTTFQGPSQIHTHGWDEENFPFLLSSCAMRRIFLRSVYQQQQSLLSMCWV